MACTDDDFAMRLAQTCACDSEQFCGKHRSLPNDPSLLSFGRGGMMLKKSLQTITWGDPQHQRFDHIFRVAASAGYDGVEVGFRRLSQVSPSEASDLLAKHQLDLSACHIGGNLTDLAQAKSERAALDHILGFLEKLQVRNLIYSGLNVRSDQEIDIEVTKMSAMVQDCAAQGVNLLYHNHAWEFKDDQRIWKRLLDANIEALGYAPDLGWAVKSGYGVDTLLSKVGDKTHVLHFKDFETWTDKEDTCPLGSGVIDFSSAWDWLADRQSSDIWLTAEQDHSDNTEADCISNGAYLGRHMAQLQ